MVVAGLTKSSGLFERSAAMTTHSCVVGSCLSSDMKAPPEEACRSWCAGSLPEYYHIRLLWTKSTYLYQTKIPYESLLAAAPLGSGRLSLNPG
jgi:hypothetical protein